MRITGTRAATSARNTQRNLEASNRVFIRLVEEAHKRGMKVILDGVFNHCGSFNKWMDRERIYEDQPDYPKGAFIARESLTIITSSFQRTQLALQ